MTLSEHFEKLKRAFENDGYFVVNLKRDERFKNIPAQYVSDEGYILLTNGSSGDKIGILAEHKTIKSVTGVPKRVYYVEGAYYDMGFMIGLMGEREITRMAYDYVDNVVFDFIHLQLPEWLTKILGAIITKIMYPESERLFEKSVPTQYKDELQGMVDGSAKVNPKMDTDEVTKRLKVLNFGVDCMVAHIYTGKLSSSKSLGIPPYLLNIPVMCNAMSVCGDVVKDNTHYFGRDFMFPTAGVFQDTACLTIYKPDGGDIPLVSQTAPGFLGSVAAMNREGVSIGVDMSPSAFCNVEDPGLNTLLLNRYSLHSSGDMESLESFMKTAKRGVPWLYPTADGKSGTSCIFEAGICQEQFPYLEYIKNIPLTNFPLAYLPDKGRIDEIRSQYANAPAPEMGLVTRMNNYNGDYTLEYNKQFNENLWNKYPMAFLNFTLQTLLKSIDKAKKQGKFNVEEELKHLADSFHPGNNIMGVSGTEDKTKELGDLISRLLDDVSVEGIGNVVKQESGHEKGMKVGIRERALNKLTELIGSGHYQQVHHLLKDMVVNDLELKINKEELEHLRVMNNALLDRMRGVCKTVKYNRDWFGTKSYINKAVDNENGFELEENCPGPYYFAPQRENLDNVSLVSNHCISPEMRLTAMTTWITLALGGQLNDIQWRYDELNNELLTAVETAKSDPSKKIDETMAWKLINFLSPEPGYNFPHYYNKNPQIPWENVLVNGSISLFDLKAKWILSKFGYYGDQPIKITLPNYL